METSRKLALEDIYRVVARDSAVSALASVIASYQTELVERSGGQALREESHPYYVGRAERLIRRYQLSEIDVVADAIDHVVDAMDEHDVDGFVQLPEIFNDAWPKLPDMERALSTPAAYPSRLTAAKEQNE